MTMIDALAALYHEHQGDAPCWHAQHTYPPECEAFAQRATRDPAFREAFTAALAEALHDWRTTRSLAGCGWVFGSRISAEASASGQEGPLCPCPDDAAAIVAHLLPEADHD